MIVRVGVGEETCSMGAVGPFRPLAASICSIRLAVTCAAAEPQTNRIPRASTLPAFGVRKMRLSVNGCFIAGCPYGRNRSIGGMNPYSIARSEEHTSELQSLMRISYAVFCLTKKNSKHQLNLL